jgi:preprotein translocase subunit SecA
VLQQTRITLRQTDPRLHPYFTDALGEETFEQIADKLLEELDTEQHEIIESVLGWWRQNEIYRQLVLGAISELWVDYLTRVEALRVSIGLEAYAQRDPLVQYKSKASEMFTSLLAEIRVAVISRMFSMRPRQTGSAPATGGQPVPALAGGEPAPAQQGASGGEAAKKKRKRH